MNVIDPLTAQELARDAGSTAEALQRDRLSSEQDPQAGNRQPPGVQQQQSHGEQLSDRTKTLLEADRAPLPKAPKDFDPYRMARPNDSRDEPKILRPDTKKPPPNCSIL